MLPELLTAVGRAMAAERPVLVVSHDVTENAWWIAAISYLLGEHLAYQMTFTTYGHRPGYARYHLTGILPDTLPPDTHTSFQMFDFVAGRTPGQTSTLWPRCGEHRRDGLAGPVAAGGGLRLRGRERPGRLARARRRGGRTARQAPSPGEADAVARWLPGAAGRMPPSSPTSAWASRWPSRTGCSVTSGWWACSAWPGGGWLAPARVEQAERLLAGREPRTSCGVAPRPRRSGSESPAAQTARDRAVEILEEAPAEIVRAMLSWAAASGVALPEAELERYGRTRLTRRAQRRLARIITVYPAVCAVFSTAGGRTAGGGPGGAQRSARRPAHP